MKLVVDPERVNDYIEFMIMKTEFILTGYDCGTI